MIKQLITEFPLTDVPREKTITEEKIRKYTYTKDEVDVDEDEFPLDYKSSMGKNGSVTMTKWYPCASITKGQGIRINLGHAEFHSVPSSVIAHKYESIWSHMKKDGNL